MFSNGPVWGNDANGVTNTGLDKVDLWVGGLAETTNLFGGLLGSTFNYVFQNQLEKLQDGDRLYYLNRTPGMNLRTQLEGNSFSELIMRNTDGTDSLKADAFATADCKFQLANLDGTAAGFALHGGLVADDPTTTDCNETQLLLRQPNGTIQYRARNVVDPIGINGQAVYNGTGNADRIYGGNDNDTFWGGKGNDVIEGNGGDDIALGGEGNDVITDLDGADVPKGGPGNDAIDAGPGDDIVMGNEGSDFLNAGANDNETFAGPGNDFVIAGLGADAVFGDGGDDWIEGGTGQDLLQGDHGAPFFDDPAQVAPGNDIFVGQTGENDYDAEGGDDVMAQNPAIDRNAGAAGFDWAYHQYDTAPANDDMEINNNLVGVPIQVVVNRDRWQETEADSGGDFNDVILGHDTAPNTVGGAGFSGCDVLDQAGVNRIAGLSAIVPQPFTEDAAPVVAISAAGFCPLNGPVWGDGDILLGGKGSDTITGRGADDIIDGDRYLTTAIRVNDGFGNEIGRTDLMEHPALSGSFGPGSLPTMTLQQAVFQGLVDPGNLVGVRQLVVPGVPSDCAVAAPVNCDTAVFRAPIATYTITPHLNGSVTVDSNGGADGIDTLWNIEKLQFSDTTIDTPAPITNHPATGTVTLSSTTPTEGIALTATQAFTDAEGVNTASIVFDWQVEVTPGVWVSTGTLGSTFTPGNPEVGLRLRVDATFLDNAGNPEEIISTPTAAVINVNQLPVGAPALTDLSPTEGSVVSAATGGITDADGLVGVTFNFRWQQSGNGGAGAFNNIGGAPNSPNFTPAQVTCSSAPRPRTPSTAPPEKTTRSDVAATTRSTAMPETTSWPATVAMTPSTAGPKTTPFRTPVPPTGSTTSRATPATT
jgi:Ca2+-binding RTX toxin-like protein